MQYLKNIQDISFGNVEIIDLVCFLNYKSGEYVYSLGSYKMRKSMFYRYKQLITS